MVKGNAHLPKIGVKSSMVPVACTKQGQSSSDLHSVGVGRYFLVSPLNTKVFNQVLDIFLCVRMAVRVGG